MIVSTCILFRHLQRFDRYSHLHSWLCISTILSNYKLKRTNIRNAVQIGVFIVYIATVMGNIWNKPRPCIAITDLHAGVTVGSIGKHQWDVTAADLLQTRACIVSGLLSHI